jgi:hypothetical protein
MIGEHSLLGCFHGGIYYRRLLGVCTVYGRKTLSCLMLSRQYQLNMSSRTLYHVALVRTDVSENVSCTSSGFLRVIGFCKFITVKTLFISLSIERKCLCSKNHLFWGVFTGVPIINAFWDFVFMCSNIPQVMFSKD